MSSDIWFIAGRGVASGTGYSRRVFFQLEMICENFSKPKLLYPSDVTLPVEFKKYCIPVKLPMKRKDILQGTFIKEIKNLVKKEGKPRIVYGESLFHTYIVSKYCKDNSISLFFDYHGKAPEEKIKQRKSIKNISVAIYYKIIEKLTLDRCNEIIVVSENFKRNINKQHKTHVLPMIPSKIFFDHKSNGNIKKDLNINENSKVFCYLGQAQKYQLPEITLEVYKQIESRLENAHLLIITGDKDKFENKLKHTTIKNVSIISIKHSDVPLYLDNADFGFILRDDSIINKVASPTKVLEYMSRNVVPIFTQYVGDFSTLVNPKDTVLVDYHRIVKGMVDENVINQISKLNVDKPDFRDFIDEYMQNYKRNYLYLFERYLREN